MARRVSARERLATLCRRVLAEVDGARLVERVLRDQGGRGRVHVWAVGKAAQAMAAGAERALGDRFAGGLVIGKRILFPRQTGSRGPQTRSELLLADHPIPSQSSLAAAEALLEGAAALHAGEQVLLLLSGGASALVGAPVAGVTLADLQNTTQALLRGGAPIHDINLVRRHLGRVFGGRLAAATAAHIDALVLSDVRGDDPATIGSGPVSPDPSTAAQAAAIAARHKVPKAVLRALALPACETLKPGDPAFARVTYCILANPFTLRDAAMRVLTEAFAGPPAAGASGAGHAQHLAGSAHRATAARGRASARAALVDGTVEDLAKVSAREQLVDGTVEELAAEVIARARALAPGQIWLAVGEPTLVVRGDGLGGRAQHLAMLVARGLAGAGADLAFAALGSDGSDGPTHAAGAVVDGETWPDGARGRSAAESALRRCDSHRWLRTQSRLLVTGYTGTNLTDLFMVARAPLPL